VLLGLSMAWGIKRKGHTRGIVGLVMKLSILLATCLCYLFVITATFLLLRERMVLVRLEGLADAVSR